MMANEAEQMAEIMNQLIADAAAAEARADAAEAELQWLTRPPVCDNAGQPIAEMICARVLRDLPGLARNVHPRIQIRLGMNVARIRLEPRIDDVDAYMMLCKVDANAGAPALRLAIEDSRGGLIAWCRLDRSGAEPNAELLLLCDRDALQVYAPACKGYLPYVLQIKGERELHRFLRHPDGSAL
jgi:hypothetical protein